ncbi:unnamed protein product [Medioppia subpectinata]|uniref:C2H2-type domain-containing protein n=1 Tax=Medioppia subpectinata TaxID=1979941 RepID=A0A7R9Q5X6_9ACAR|nr:unnamed protein product [Medioppia subpectinata]CAG2113955.1 unnamed protein product [Medioppia subpectinata]
MNALMSELSTIQAVMKTPHVSHIVVVKTDSNAGQHIPQISTNTSQRVIQLPRLIISPSLVDQSVGDVREDSKCLDNRPKTSDISNGNEDNDTNVVPNDCNSGSNGESDGDHKCPVGGCGKNFTSLHVLGKPFKCDYENCDYICAKKYRLLEHKKSHDRGLKARGHYDRCFDTALQMYVCSHNDCDKRFATRYRLLAHTRLVHIGRRYVCDYVGCDMAFKTSDACRRHRNTHVPFGEKPLSCPHPGCGYRSSQRSYIGRHMKIHVNDGSVFVCPVDGCAKSYPRSGSLKAHTLAAHTVGRKRFVCKHPKCGRSYCNSTTLRLHSAQHCAEPTLRCRREDCSEMFGSLSALDRHMKSVHNRKRYVPKKYACEWPGCDYKAVLDQIKRHRTIHTGLKPYACDWPECGKRFRTTHSLKDHKNVHTNSKPYACHWPGCAYRCNSHPNIAKHVKQRHQNQ